jgi:hypothetical protein
MDKIPSESMGTSYGGAMTVSQAKQLRKRIGSEVKHLMTKMGSLYGGANRTIWGIELSDQMNQAADWAVTFSEGYLKIKDFMDKFLADLDRQIIKNTDYSGADADEDDKALLEFSKTLKAYFEKWKALMNTLGAIAKFIKDNLGKPPPDEKAGKGYNGGAGTWQETWTNFKGYVERNYNAMKELASWFLAHRVQVYGLLRTLDSLQPTGKTIADVLEAILGKPTAPTAPTAPTEPAAGSGKRLTLQFFVKMNKKHSRSSNKMSGGKSCKCHNGSEHSSSPLKVGGLKKRGGMDLSSIFGPSMGKIPPSYIGQDRVGPMPGGQNLAPVAPKESAAKPSGGRKKRGGIGFSPINLDPIMGTSPIYNDSELGPRPAPPRRKPSGPNMPVPPEYDIVPPSEEYASFSNNKRQVGGASCGGKKPSARGAIVKKVMREQGLSLPQASKYVKEHGLY